MAWGEKSSREFVETLASKAPTPGGGGGAAMGGALGMALSNMVGNLTLGKKKYADVEPEIRQLIDQGDAVIRELLDLVDRDETAFTPLAKAYSLPKNTPEEKAHKETVLSDCSKEASSVPMEIMRKAFEGIRIHNRMGEIGTRIAISDVGCGVVFLKAALQAAQLNVLINLPAIKDDAYVADMRAEMDRLAADGCRLADETLESVKGALG